MPMQMLPKVNDLNKTTHQTYFCRLIMKWFSRPREENYYMDKKMQVQMHNKFLCLTICTVPHRSCQLQRSTLPCSSHAATPTLQQPCSYPHNQRNCTATTAPASQYCVTGHISQVCCFFKFENLAKFQNTLPFPPLTV